MMAAGVSGGSGSACATVLARIGTQLPLRDFDGSRLDEAAAAIEHVSGRLAQLAAGFPTPGRQAIRLLPVTKDSTISMGTPAVTGSCTSRSSAR